MRAKLKGARKLRRDKILAGVTEADKEILKEYRMLMFTVPGKPPQRYRFNDGFYLETLGYLREDWNELAENMGAPEPTIGQMWVDLKEDVDATMMIRFPHSEGR